MERQVTIEGEVGCAKQIERELGPSLGGLEELARGTLTVVANTMYL